MKIHSQHTDSQCKHNKISIVFFSLVFVLLVSAITLSNPDNVKAADGGIWTVDSGSQPYVYIPGSLYWAGSEQKTGLLIYCVNTRTGSLIPNTTKILYKNDVADGERWIEMCQDQSLIGGTPRIVGYTSGATTRYYQSCADLPDKTGSFAEYEGNTIKNWMESDSGMTDYGGRRMSVGARIAYTKLGMSIYDKIISKEYTLCFEGMYGFAHYKNVPEPGTGTAKSAAQMLSSRVAESMYGHLSGEAYYKASIKKYFYTLRQHVFLMNINGIKIDTKYGSGGTLNFKWIQGCAKYFRTEQDHFGVPAARAVDRMAITYSEMYGTGWNFGVMITANNPIHTYYAPNGTPGAPEPPSSTRHTDGPCTIRKLYYTETYDSDHNLLSTEYHGPYEQQNTTNEIVIDAEAGYTIEKYKTSTQDRRPTSKEAFNNDIPAACSRHTGRGSTTITIQECSPNEKYLYVLYKKEIIEPEPPEPYQFKLSIHW